MITHRQKKEISIIKELVGVFLFTIEFSFRIFIEREVKMQPQLSVYKNKRGIR